MIDHKFKICGSDICLCFKENGDAGPKQTITIPYEVSIDIIDLIKSSVWLFNRFTHDIAETGLCLGSACLNKDIPKSNLNFGVEIAKDNTDVDELIIFLYDYTTEAVFTFDKNDANQFRNELQEARLVFAC